MKSPLSQHRSSAASSPTLHYVHQSPRLSVCPTCASQHPKTAKPSLPTTQDEGVDASTQWSPMSPRMNVESSKKETLVDASTQWSPISPKMKAESSKKENFELQNRTSVSRSAAPSSSSFKNKITEQKPSSIPPPVSIIESPTMKRRQSQAVDNGSVYIPDKTQTLPPKRVRSTQTRVKVLPLRYEMCEVEDMVVLIANMISELIQTNDELPLRTGVLTRFHSRYV